MTCQFLPCNCCNRLIKSTNVAITGTSPNEVLTITVPSTVTLENLENYCLIICQSIPTNANSLPIHISNGTFDYITYCKKGNYLRADQIRARKKYCITFGNDPNHILFLNPVCPTSHIV